DSEGEPITFYISDKIIGISPAQQSIHVFDFESTSIEIKYNKAARLAQLLQTLDANNNTADGIQLTPELKEKFKAANNIEFIVGDSEWERQMLLYGQIANNPPVSLTVAYDHASKNLADKCSIPVKNYYLTDGVFNSSKLTCLQRVKLELFLNETSKDLMSYENDLWSDEYIANGEKIADETIKQALKKNIAKPIFDAYKSFYKGYMLTKDENTIDIAVRAERYIFAMSLSKVILNGMYSFCDSRCMANGTIYEGTSIIIDTIKSSSACMNYELDQCGEILIKIIESNEFGNKFFGKSISHDDAKIFVNSITPALKVFSDMKDVNTKNGMLNFAGDSIEVLVKYASGSYFRSDEQSLLARKSYLLNGIDLLAETSNALITCGTGIINVSNSIDCHEKVFNLLYERLIVEGVTVAFAINTVADLKSEASKYRLSRLYIEELLSKKSIFELYKEYSIDYTSLEEDSQILAQKKLVNAIAIKYNIDTPISAVVMPQPFFYPMPYTYSNNVYYSNDYFINDVINIVNLRVRLINVQAENYIEGKSNICALVELDDIKKDNIIAKYGYIEGKSSYTSNLLSGSPDGYIFSWGDGSELVYSDIPAAQHQYMSKGYFNLVITPYFVYNNKIAWSCDGRAKTSIISITSPLVGLRAARGDSSATLAWNSALENNPLFKGYGVCYSHNSFSEGLISKLKCESNKGTWISIEKNDYESREDKPDFTSLSYKIKSLKNDVNYHIVISAIDRLDNTIFTSNQTTIIPLSDNTTPKNVKIFLGKNNAFLKWDTVPNAKNYTYCISKVTWCDPQSLITTTNHNFALVDGLENNIDYYFQVRSTTTQDSDYSLATKISFLDTQNITNTFNMAVENLVFASDNNMIVSGKTEPGAQVMIVEPSLGSIIIESDKITGVWSTILKIGGYDNIIIVSWTESKNSLLISSPIIYLSTKLDVVTINWLNLKQEDYQVCIAQKPLQVVSGFYGNSDCVVANGVEIPWKAYPLSAPLKISGLKAGTYYFVLILKGKNIFSNMASIDVAGLLPEVPTITKAEIQADGRVLVTGAGTNNSTIIVTWPDFTTTTTNTNSTGLWSITSSATSYSAGSTIRAKATLGNSESGDAVTSLTQVTVNLSQSCPTKVTSILFKESFNGNASGSSNLDKVIDSSKWNVKNPNSSIWRLENGSLSLAQGYMDSYGGMGPMGIPSFPYIYTKTNPFPNAGNFSFYCKASYSDSKGGNSACMALQFLTNELEVGSNVGLWGKGTHYSSPAFFQLFSKGNYLTDPYFTDYNPSFDSAALWRDQVAADGVAHEFEVCFINNEVWAYKDGSKVAQSLLPSDWSRPNAIMLGSIFEQMGLWSSFSTDEIEVRQLDNTLVTPPLETTGWIQNPANGHYYKALENCGNWEQCETSAQLLGAHLVMTEDPEESTWVLNTFGRGIGGSSSFFIGLTDKRQQDNDWRWISGEVPAHPAIVDYGAPWLVGQVDYGFMDWEWGYWSFTSAANESHIAKAVIERTNSPSEPNIMANPFTVQANDPVGKLFTVPTSNTQCVFNATGTWRVGNEPIDFDANGLEAWSTPSKTLQSAPLMALLTKRSNGQLEFVGASRQMSVNGGEPLRFLANDAVDTFYNNTGSLSVSWTCQ
ncbi:MAG: hypothetical protein RLZZ422_2013, partial [Pseudomonadota bacterium]